MSGVDAKRCHGRGAGVVAASTAEAVEAGCTTLRAGGNAVDAAVATCLALMVTDPANTSVGGRCHILVADTDGRVTAIDGASQAPSSPDPAHPEIPLPGALKALAMAHDRFGRLARHRLVAPARSLAREGFTVGRALAQIVARYRSDLEGDEAAARVFRDSAGHLPAEGGRWRQPALADLLDRLCRDGLEAFHTHPEMVASSPWSAEDLAACSALEGEVVTHRTFGHDIHTIGRQGWGHSLIELLGLLERLDPAPLQGPAAFAPLIHALAQMLEDRPEEAGTLAAKPEAPPLDSLVDPAFLDERAAMIRRRLVEGGGLGPSSAGRAEERDTTHLSVIDGEGLAVALTTSIGPHLGARKAHSRFGFLYPLSYRMRSGFVPGLRDVTEMTPAIVVKDGRPILAIGAAGSERVPMATAQVLYHRLGAGLPLDDAMAAPRITLKNGVVRLWRGADRRTLRDLGRRGYRVERAGPGHIDHVGIVHAAERLGDGSFVGVADAAYDGAAGLAVT